MHLTDDPIIALRPRSILTKSGQEYPADTIVSIIFAVDDHRSWKGLQANILPAPNKVLATGFSLTQYDVELIGRNGRTRSEHWSAFGYKEAYKSIAMSQFPNFFYVLGPNSGKGHTSTIYSIEKSVLHPSLLHILSH